MQYLLHKNNKSYDKLELDMSDGTTKTIWFDITSFFGKERFFVKEKNGS